MANRFETLKEAYTNLALTPLREQRVLEQFRVEYGQSVLLELEQIIEDDVDSPRWQDCLFGASGLWQVNALSRVWAALRESALWATMNTESNGQMENMPVVKLFSQVSSRQEQPELLEENKQRLCEMLSRRMTDEIIEAEIIEAIVLKSGVLRELIRIARKCCQICLREIRRSKTLETVKIEIFLSRRLKAFG